MKKETVSVGIKTDDKADIMNTYLLVTDNI